MSEDGRHLLPRFVIDAARERVQADTLGGIVESGTVIIPSAADQLRAMRDESYLRGIPAVGRNAPGVMPGTMPGV